uniref:Divergent polysaccharide deacetylase family protein n=1 Tax=Eiseniibacteriota bacterium TaxID=2212470 RepID=A0A832I2A3_UNCEI
MPRKKSRSAPSMRVLALLAAAAIALFAAGEAFLLGRTDRGRILLARLGFGDPARAVQVISRQVRHGLQTMQVPRDSVRETVREGGRAPLRWTVGLRPETSTLQVHWAIAQALGEVGAVVLEGRERHGARGEQRVTLLVGLPGRATHEVTLVRWPRADDAERRPAGGRIALVLYGLPETAAEARPYFEVAAPFAVVVVGGGRESRALHALARDSGREVVVALPLEPINYPSVNPGPGTILVTMSPSQVAGRVRKYVEQAASAVAVSNHMGSLATQDMQVMGAVYRELRRARLTFVHVNPVPGSVCKSLAASSGVAYDEPDAILDDEARAPDTRALDRRWKQLLERARERGATTVWVRATPIARQWLARAAEPKRLEGASLVPLSAVIRRPVGT